MHSQPLNYIDIKKVGGTLMYNLSIFLKMLRTYFHYINRLFSETVQVCFDVLKIEDNSMKIIYENH